MLSSMAFLFSVCMASVGGAFSPDDSGPGLFWKRHCFFPDVSPSFRPSSEKLRLRKPVTGFFAQPKLMFSSVFHKSPGDETVRIFFKNRGFFLCVRKKWCYGLFYDGLFYGRFLVIHR